MKLKVNNVIGFFEVDSIKYIPNMLKYVEDGINIIPNIELDEEEEEQECEDVYNMLAQDDRFTVYKGDTFASSEVYIKEGTEVEMTRLSRYLNEGMEIVVGDFLFYIPNLAYIEGDLTLTEEPYKWENFSDEELKARGVEIYVPIWKKIQDRRKCIKKRLRDMGIYED